MLFKKYKLDVIIGMYHDQVLTPFKTLFKYDAINITLGLPCIRVTPDHGVAENIMGKKIANPKSLIKLKIKVKGPVSADSSFMFFQKNKFDVIIGMYHDQILTPFKALFNFDATNITLGLPYIRTSPDHGIAENIVGKRIANPKSLIESIKFFNYIK